MCELFEWLPGPLNFVDSAYRSMHDKVAARFMTVQASRGALFAVRPDIGDLSEAG
jgi:hypothetical protein